MPEEAESNFIIYLKKQEASPNTVKSCLASCRLYYSLFDGLNMTNLMQYKDYLLNHYKAATVNNRIYGINRYLDSLIQSQDNNTDTNYVLSFRLPAVQTQQVSFVDDVISQEDYVVFKDSLKSDGNMFWYFVVRFLACTGARVSELIQMKAEHLDMRYMDL